MRVIELAHRVVNNEQKTYGFTNGHVWYFISDARYQDDINTVFKNIIDIELVKLRRKYNTLSKSELVDLLVS